ncbi:MAG: GGDEF domain-containing protein, partial [Magnetococcales bacterium]|nr:GGDEF domain-containing protein [Magnetococcales bacterium]
MAHGSLHSCRSNHDKMHGARGRISPGASPVERRAGGSVPDGTPDEKVHAMPETFLYSEVVDITSERDRIGLVERCRRTLHSINAAEDTHFYDIDRQRYVDGAKGVEAFRIYLINPLDPRRAELPVGVEKGVSRCLECKELVVVSSAIEGMTRVIFPIMDNFEVRSLFVQDLPVFDSEIKDKMVLIGSMFTNLESMLKAKDQDPLTGLLNRRSFDETISSILETQIPRAGGKRDPGEGACLAILDIDHFKKVNDVFGHAIGDEV